MIFGAAKAINREHNAIGDCDAVIFDLGEVERLGLTAALAIENAVEEAMVVGCTSTWWVPMAPLAGALSS